MKLETSLGIGSTLPRETNRQTPRLTLTIAAVEYSVIPSASGWILHKRKGRKVAMYRVWIENGWPVCTCEAFGYGHGEPCKHILNCEAVGLLPKVSDGQ